jgi:hypothetical protein
VAYAFNNLAPSAAELDYLKYGSLKGQPRWEIEHPSYDLPTVWAYPATTAHPAWIVN